MWEVWTRQLPFEHIRHTAWAIRDAVAAGERPPSAGVGPPDYAELMEVCWHADPVLRPTFFACVERLAVMQADAEDGTRTSTMPDE